MTPVDRANLATRRAASINLRSRPASSAQTHRVVELGEQPLQPLGRARRVERNEHASCEHHSECSLEQPRGSPERDRNQRRGFYAA